MLCVIAKIDEESRIKLANLQLTAESFGIPPRKLYGHITLSTLVCEEEDAYIAFCKTTLRDVKAFSVLHEQVEVLSATSIIVASPKKRGDLENIQKTLTAGWENKINMWTKPDVWYPHTTLLYKPDADLNAICKAMTAIFHPFTAKIERIEFSNVTDNGYHIMDSISLPR